MSRYDSLFNIFASEIQTWSRDYTLPKCANQDIKKFLELRKERFEKFGLKYEYTLEEWPNSHVIGSISLSNSKNYYYNRMYGEKVVFRNKKNNVIYKKNRRINFIEVIYDTDEDSSKLEKIPYNCPNCGSVSSVDVLRSSGCPYCNTKYMVGELFPKVINYYTYDSFAIREKKLKFRLNLMYFICYIISFFILFMTRSNEFPLVVTIIYDVFVSFILAFMFSFLFYYCFGVIFLIKLFGLALRAIILLPFLMINKNKLIKNLKKYFPDFKFEYFEGQISSILKTVIYSEEQSSYPLYLGENIEKFNNIVDSEYSMIKSFEIVDVNDKEITIKIKASFKNLYYKHGGIKKKNEDFVLTMKHALNKSLCDEFSIYAINCKNCGGSFDISTDNKCPYCNTEFDIDEKHWIVTAIR